MSQPAPRRGLDDPVVVPTVTPRRALDEATPAPRRLLEERVIPNRSRGISGWGFTALLGSGLAVLVAGLYGFYGVRSDSTAAPSPRTPTSASTLHGTPSPLPSPSPAPVPTRQESLGGASVSVPQHWETYHEEDTDDGHRLIRLRHPTADLRLQLATVADVGALPEACAILVEDQSTDWTVEHYVLPRTLSTIDGAAAVTCGFAGTEPEANTATTAQFTLVDGDDETLVLRDLRPSGLGADTTVLAEAAAMHCEAAATFGHPLPLCAPTPADRAGG